MAGYLYSIRPVFVIYFVQLDNDNLYHAFSLLVLVQYPGYLVTISCFSISSYLVFFLFLFLFFNFSFDEELVFYSQVQLISVRRSCKKKIGNVTIRDAIHDPSWNSEEKRNATEQNFALDAIRFHYLWMTLQVALNRSVVLAIDIPTCRAPLSWLCSDSALYPDVSGYCLKRQIWNSLWRPIYVMNSLMILNYPVIPSHRRSATVSLETWLLYKFKL